MPLIYIYYVKKNSNYTIQGRSLNSESNKQKPANNWKKESSIFTDVSLTKKTPVFS